MNITLINPRSTEFIPGGSLNNCFPLGLAYVANALLAAGRKLEVIDFNVDQRTVEGFKNDIRKMDVVGITTMVGGSLHNALNMIELIKATNESAVVVVGGAIASACPSQFLKETKADIVVVGEGETTVIELLERLEKGLDISDLHGIGFRRNGEVHVNDVSSRFIDLNAFRPAYELFRVPEYFHRPVIEIGRRPFVGFTSRGCPFFCRFCRPNLGRKYRSKSVEKIMEELSFLKNNYGVDGIQFYDDNFLHDRERIFNLCDGMRESGLDILWVCEGRAGSVDSELVRKMKESGCVSIFMGIESGSDDVLRNMKKGLNKALVHKAAKIIRDEEMPFWGNFMIGMPEETRRDVWDTVKMIYKLLKIESCISSGYFVPRPNTEWFEYAIKMGMQSPTLRDWADYNRCYKFGINLSKMRRHEVKLYYYLITLMSLFNRRGLRRIRRVIEVSRRRSGQ